MKTTALAATALLILTGLTWAQTTTAPAGQTDDAVVRILDRQAEATAKFDSLTAKMDYRRINTLVDDVTHREGSVAVMRKPKAGPNGTDLNFGRIHFDTLETDLYKSDKKETLSFYDRYLLELNEKSKQFVRREIVPQGKAINLFRIGEGPFPLPIWQTRQDVLDNFSVKLVASAKTDPANSDHLELTPLAGKNVAGDQKKIQLFISRESALPVRIVTEDSKNERVIVDLLNIKLNPDLKEADFNITPPPGYDVIEVPLKK